MVHCAVLTAAGGSRLRVSCVGVRAAAAAAAATEAAAAAAAAAVVPDKHGHQAVTRKN